MNPHLQAQLLRFVRLTVLAFLGQLAVTGTENLGWKSLAALAVGAIEAAVRQIWPVAPLPAASDAPVKPPAV